MTTEMGPLPVAVGGDSPAVTVRGLGKLYGGRAVLDGLDLDIRAG
jgi:ABC-2 type transport system ATP-binding protein